MSAQEQLAKKQAMEEKRRRDLQKKLENDKRETVDKILNVKCFDFSHFSGKGLRYRLSLVFGHLEMKRVVFV